MHNGRTSILIADDEVKMVKALSDFFRANSFEVLKAYDGQEALKVYYEHKDEIDIMLLDVMMPEYDGFEVLRRLREDAELVPVIMLTARSEEYDELRGFRCGADDYVPKPFSPSLLLARVESILKRTGQTIKQEIKCGDIVINSMKRSVYIGDNYINLTRREFDLLYFLIVNKGITLTRQQILTSVWGYDFDGDIRTVDTHIKQLRMKLGAEGDHIKTLHRVGYRLEDEI